MSPAQRRRAAHRFNRGAATFASILMTAGLVIALAGGYGVWRGWETLAWPTTEATLVTNRVAVEEETRTVPMTDRLRGGIRETVGALRLDLQYRYAVDGVSFEGRALEPWDFGLPGLGKAQALAALAAGPTHPVSYDVRDPRRAYLLPGPSTAAGTLAIIGLVLAAVGFMIGRIQRRS